MRILLRMRSRVDIILREHYVRDLVVSHDQDTVRIMVGVGEDHSEGWIVTDKDVLELLRETDRAFYFRPNTMDAILAEYDWEHLDSSAAIVAAQYCFKYLKPDGYIRVTVPDGCTWI